MVCVHMMLRVGRNAALDVGLGLVDDVADDVGGYCHRRHARLPARCTLSQCHSMYVMCAVGQSQGLRCGWIVPVQPVTCEPDTLHWR